MNAPIINPMWIYLIDIIKETEFFVYVIAVLLLCGVIIGIIAYGTWYAEEYLGDEEDIALNRKFIKLIRKGIIALVISVFAIIAIPNQKTIYTMITTLYITPENLEKTGNSVESMVDYIFEKIDELKDNNDES